MIHLWLIQLHLCAIQQLKLLCFIVQVRAVIWLGDTTEDSSPLMLHPCPLHRGSIHCTWTSSLQMLKLYTIKSFSFCETFSTCGGLNFKTPRISCIGCSTRLSAIMASTVSTYVPTEQEPVADLGGSIQKPTPLQVAKRLEKFKTTIFTQMSSLAIKHGAINLGQGFSNFDGPGFVKEATIQAIRYGKNQYARGYGVPDLNSTVAKRFKKYTGLMVDPEKEVTVTSGCTEAIAATILGLINPGEEVILFAPFYDSYEATLSMAGANITCVTLRPQDFSAPIDELRKIVSKDTRAILMSTPHNPMGEMFTREELDAIASLCIEHDILVYYRT